MAHNLQNDQSDAGVVLGRRIAFHKAPRSESMENFTLLVQVLATSTLPMAATSRGTLGWINVHDENRGCRCTVNLDGNDQPLSTGPCFGCNSYRKGKYHRRRKLSAHHGERFGERRRRVDI